MADGLYLLTLQITSKVVSIMNEEEKKMVETAGLFVASSYGLGFLNPILGQSLPQIIWLLSRPA